MHAHGSDVLGNAMINDITIVTAIMHYLVAGPESECASNLPGGPARWKLSRRFN